MSEDWLPRRAVVVGLARSGRAAVAALEQRGVEVLAVDRTLGNEDPAAATGVQLLVKSPGVPAENPVVRAARAEGVPVWSEVELGYRLLPEESRLIGVTGTNGKTTTTELLAAILRADGRRAEVAGNVGRALTEVAEEIEDDTWVVCELSSFQLEDVQALSCDVAVLLNLEPDHLDRHGSFEAYRDAKLRIFEHARAKVVPRGLGLEGIEFAADDPLPAEPRIPGAHNRENAAAATAAARVAGVGDDAIADALRTFEGVPHRLELVRELRGVRWVNDSKATNTAAARRGVAAYDAPLRLILGGSLKGEDFGPFAHELPATVRSIYLVGEASDELAAALDAAGRAYERSGDLAHAIEQAAADAQHGDIVLLSPAAASFDQFDDFEQRGAAFRRLVEELS
jgi:UDP-N-acetylmuramoylalanine--D-glutamate ligase